LAFVEHAISGYHADWIIHNATKRHATGGESISIGYKLFYVGIFIRLVVTTETGREFFSETRETVTVSDKRERFGLRGLKPSNNKSNAREHIPSCGLWLSFSHALLR